MATTTESVPDVATSGTPDPRRASTAPTEESASGVGLPDQRRSYGPQPEDEDEEMQDQYQNERHPEEAQSHLPQNGEAKHPQVPIHDLSPAAEYLTGIMAEFRKLEGKLASLLTEQARLKDENEELRSRPPVPDPATLQDLETLTTKYNKVKKLYFQKETQVDQLGKENEALRADAEEAESLRNENQELNRDLDILAKERDQIAQDREQLAQDLAAVTKERDSLSGHRESFEQERESLERERETLEQERDAALQDRDSVLQERDSILQERDDALRDRDAAEKEKEDALQDKQDLSIERDEARQDREHLQNKVKDLEDEVAKLQAQNTAAHANGVRDKRVSGPPAGHASTGSDYPQEILKLKYDKVKRLYYEQQKTISHLEDRLRSAEAMRAEDEFLNSRGPEPIVSRSNSKGKQRASYVSPERDSYRGEGVNAKSPSTDAPPQRRRSVRTSGRRGTSLDTDRMSIGTDDDVL